MSEVEAQEPSSAVPAVEVEQPSQEAQTPEVTETETPEVEATETEEVSSGEPETTVNEEPEKPKKNGFKERISELTRQREEAKARADAAEARAELMAQEYGLNDETEQEPFPKLEDYGFDEQAFQQAVSEYNSRQTEKAVARATLKQEQAQLKESLRKQLNYATEAFKVRANEFAQTTPDYQAKVSDPNFVQSVSVQEAVIMNENGPEIAYYLASNPNETAEINQLSPVMAGMRIANIAAKLSAPAPVIQSKTPDPITPVVPSGSVEKDPSNMSPNEYREWRMKGRAK